MSDRTPRIKGGWQGRYVKTRRPMQTGGGDKFPAGSLMQVVDVYSGLELRTAIRCPTCMRDHATGIRRVSTLDVEVMPVDFQPAPELDVIGRLTKRIAELEAERNELLSGEQI